MRKEKKKGNRQYKYEHRANRMIARETGNGTGWSYSEKWRDQCRRARNDSQDRIINKVIEHNSKSLSFSSCFLRAVCGDAFFRSFVRSLGQHSSYTTSVGFLRQWIWLATHNHTRRVATSFQRTVRRIRIRMRRNSPSKIKRRRPPLTYEKPVKYASELTWEKIHQ